MQDIIKFTLSGKPEYIKVVRMGIASFAYGFGFDADEIEDIKLAVAEACKLVICHRNSAWNDYEVKCEIIEGGIKLTLTQSNEGCLHEKCYRPCKNCPQEGDLAPVIIKTLMDEVAIDTLADGRKCIVMVKKNGKLRSI